MRAKLGKVQNARVVEDTAGGKNRDTASVCLAFKGRGRFMTSPLIKSNSLFAAGLVTAYETKFSTGEESTKNFLIDLN